MNETEMKLLCKCKEKMSGSQKKSERELRSFWKFHVVVVQNNGKEMYKKSVLHVQSRFFAN